MQVITPRENLSCSICGFFCNNDYHFNCWFKLNDIDINEGLRMILISLGSNATKERFIEDATKWGVSKDVAEKYFDKHNKQ